MNVLRCTVIDHSGGISFLTHGDALPALVAACGGNPETVDVFLSRVEPNYHSHTTTCRPASQFSTSTTPPAATMPSTRR